MKAVYKVLKGKDSMKKRNNQDKSIQYLSIAMYLFIISMGINIVLLWKVVNEITLVLGKIF